MRRLPILSSTFLLAAVPAALAGQVAPPEVQISAASYAAPEDRRADATVLGYNAEGEFVKLRAGTNDMICLADDPAREGFETACYHESLEPFMARGRELTAQGVTGMTRQRQRWSEVESGALKMPDQLAMQYILTGEGFDPETGTVAGEYRRSVIYIPFATAESTGLSTRASAVDPWIMSPGTAGAHIMITPPRPRSGG